MIIDKRLSRVWSQRQQQQQGAPGFLFPGHISQFWLGDQSQCNSPQGTRGPNWMSLEHLPLVTRKCPNLLNWLLSLQRSSTLHPGPSWMTELLTLSLLEMPAALLRTLISVACICDLVLSVKIRPLWSKVREGKKVTGRWTLCLLAQLFFRHNYVCGIFLINAENK